MAKRQPVNPVELEKAKQEALALVNHSVDIGKPVAFEVVRTKTRIEVQPFGMHALFKSHELLHVEAIPQSAR